MSQVLPAVARSPPHTYPVDRGVGCSVQIGAIHLVNWVDRMKGGTYLHVLSAGDRVEGGEVKLNEVEGQS